MIRSLPGTHAATRGLTLIELMVVVAIVALLGAIATPLYLDSVRKGRRADGIAALNQLMLMQERYRANQPQYATHLLISGGALVGVGSADDAGAVASASTPGAGHYLLSIVSAGASGYTVRAVGQGGQAADAACVVLQVGVTGGNIVHASGATAALGNATAANNTCWRF
jgi:type IV pilus assembly protein PilE